MEQEYRFNITPEEIACIYFEGCETKDGILFYPDGDGNITAEWSDQEEDDLHYTKRFRATAGVMRAATKGEDPRQWLCDMLNDYFKDYKRMELPF